MTVTPARLIALVSSLVVLCGVVGVLALLIGPSSLPIGEVISVLTGGDSSQVARAIVYERLSRSIAALITGAALSVAGVIFQAVLRNPLSEPYILGVSGGAGVGAALFVLATGGLIGMSSFGVAGFAVIGALCAVIVVMSVEYRYPRIGMEGVILLGVMINAVCGSLIICIASYLGEGGLISFYRWLLGSFSISPYGSQNLVPAALLTILLTIALLIDARRLNLLMLTTNEATALGVRASLMRRYALAMAGILSAVAVALAGLVGFVGLVVPHIARKLWGGDLRLLIPASALLGGALLIACDTVARTVMSPSEMPVGVITAIIGAPVFILILIARSRVISE